MSDGIPNVIITDFGAWRDQLGGKGRDGGFDAFASVFELKDETIPALRSELIDGK